MTLTNYAKGFAQDTDSALADFIAPITPVSFAKGQYQDFDDKNAFQLYDSKRGIGAPATRIEFHGTPGNYNCLPNALELPIDDHEAALAGAGDPLKMRMAKARVLVTSAVLSRENEVHAAWKTAVSAVGSRGSWSDLATNDPVEELDEQIEAITNLTGMMPNRLVLGLGAWRMFRSHAKVIARQPGSGNIGVTFQQAAAMLLNPNIEIRVGILSKDGAKFGAAASKSNIVGDEALLFIGSDSPSEYDPSFMKTFRTDASGVETVREYRDESARSDILAVDWTEDLVVTGAIAAKRLTIS